LDPTTILTLSMQGSARDIVGAWIRDRSARNRRVRLKAGDQAIDLSDDLSDADREELAEKVEKLLTERSSANVEVPSESQASTVEEVVEAPVPRSDEPDRRPLTDALSRRLLTGSANAPPVLPAEVGGFALDTPPEFFLTARRRIALVFRLNICLALILAFILFGAIILLIVAAFTGHGALIAVFGGVSVADLIGVYAFKPLAEISSSVIASQRLEIIHMRLLSQLRTCAEQVDPEKRRRCQTGVWNAIQKDIAAMSSSSR
jgi:hypothetical protein